MTQSTCVIEVRSDVKPAHVPSIHDQNVIELSTNIWQNFMCQIIDCNKIALKAAIRCIVTETSWNYAHMILTSLEKL